MNIWILALECVETRYTGEWWHNVPEQLLKVVQSNGQTADYKVLYDDVLLNSDVNIYTIPGRINSSETTPGAFLNFAATNIWKSSQMEKVAELFSNNIIKNGDKFLITDAWNPAILQLKYMIDLYGLDCRIHAIWHAGGYDPHDFLGRLIPDRKWTKCTEKALYHAIDYNYFATQYHIDLFIQNVFDNFDEEKNYSFYHKMNKSGQPHELMVENISKFNNQIKLDKIIFPHRVAPEKNPDMFIELSKDLTKYEFLVCQDYKLTKEEYHKHMGSSKIMFSASMQETLGIGAMEAILVGCIPLLPDRLSYSEMYLDYFKYPSEWTDTWDNFVKNKTNLINLINTKISEFGSERSKNFIEKQKHILLSKYLSACNMYGKILEIDNGV